MPQKNTLKEYQPDSYYHVYSRGINKQKIFLEAADQRYFISLFERYLSGKKAISKTGELYPDFSQDIKLLSYCLMPNHVHLLLYQLEDRQALRHFMSSLMTSYSKYFNYKYRRVGSVFESRYKAKRIDAEGYLAHISRYIHMNPRRWETYRYSSLSYVFNRPIPPWLAIQDTLEGFINREDYLQFLRDYQTNKDLLEVIKDQLADK